MGGGRGWLLPREHGAWGMLLLPFFAAAVLAREWNAALPVSLAVALSIFLMREPLLVLARQRWVWRERRPESARAQRYLIFEVAAAAACGAYLWRELPRAPLAVLGAVAAGMTLFATAMALANRQRSVAMQILVSASLGSTSLLAALAATGRVAPWAWQLWGLLTLHSVAAIFIVRARLASRTKEARRAWKTALLMEGALAAAGVAVLVAGGAALAVPVFFSAGVNAIELRRVRVAERLTRVGLRTLSFSVAQAALSVAVLWHRAGG